MNFFGKHKKLILYLSIPFLFVTGCLVFTTIYFNLSNSSAEKRLKSDAPVIASRVNRYFDEVDISQTEKAFSCRDSSVKFSSPDRYCSIEYEVQVAPKAKAEENYAIIRDLYDTLLKDGWDVGTLTSVNSWNDTLIKPATGEMLQPNKYGAMEIEGEKTQGNGVLCQFSLHYVTPKPHHETQYGIFKYGIGCNYKVKKIKII